MLIREMMEEERAKCACGSYSPTIWTDQPEACKRIIPWRCHNCWRLGEYGTIEIDEIMKVQRRRWELHKKRSRRRARTAGTLY